MFLDNTVPTGRPSAAPTISRKRTSRQLLALISFPLLFGISAEAVPVTISTPIGRIRAIAVGPSGDIYVAGVAPAQPATPGSFGERSPEKDRLYCQVVNPPPCDTGFVARLEAAGMTVRYFGYLGGNRDDQITGLAVDAAGNAYVAGTTTSTDFPATAGALRANQRGGLSAFVAKVNAAGTALAYSATIGPVTGSVIALAVDSNGNAYIGGPTLSPDFPVTANAFQIENDGGYASGFLAKLNATGDRLVYSGRFDGIPNAIAVDRSGNAFVSGVTLRKFRSTPGAYQSASGGSFDAFLMKLNAEGSVPIYASYLGGPSDDAAAGIAVDAEGAAYVAGTSSSLGGTYYSIDTGEVTYLPPGSPGFPLTAGAFQTEFGGSFRPGTSSDAFVAKLSADGAKLVYSTYLGGGSADSAQAIAVDGNGNAIVTGWSDSDNFPASPGADQPCLRRPRTSLEPANDTYVAMLDSRGGRLLYGTRLDGSGGAAVALGGPGRIYASSGAYNGTAVSAIDVNAPAGPPRLACVANAANYVAGAIAPGEIVSLFGSGFEDAVRVLFDDVPGQILFAGPNQVNAVVPADVAAKETVTVKIEPAGTALTASVVSAQNGIFTAGGRGSGQAAVLNEDGSRNSVSSPAARGSAVTFFSTGMGEPFAHYEVYIGSSTGSEVLSVEPLLDVPGVVRFRARIPGDAVKGPEVPFVVVIDRNYGEAWYGQQVTAMAVK